MTPQNNTKSHKFIAFQRQNFQTKFSILEANIATEKHNSVVSSEIDNSLLLLCKMYVPPLKTILFRIWNPVRCSQILERSWKVCVWMENHSRHNEQNKILFFYWLLSDYHLVWFLKRYLSSKQFHTNGDVVTVVKV